VLSADSDLYCDGRKVVSFVRRLNAFTMRTLTGNARRDAPPLIGLEAFFGWHLPEALPFFVGACRMRSTQARGRRVVNLSLALDEPHRPADRIVVFYDAATAIPVGWDQTFGGTRMAYRYRGLRFNVRLDPTIFRWTRPPGAREEKRASQLPSPFFLAAQRLAPVP
jgi:hypothetical protein